MRLRLSNLNSALQIPLLVAGAVGFLVYFLLLPPVHPDAGIEVPLKSEEVRAFADDYLEAIGVDVTLLDARTSLQRNQELLRHLQSEIGLRDTRRYLAEDAFYPLPVYFHQVRYSQPSDDASTPTRIAEVHLLNDGRIVGVRTPGINEQARDVDALEDIGFEPEDEQQQLGIPAEATDEFERLALYHLSRSAWVGVGWSVDSVRILHGDRGEGASVILRGDTLVAGTTPQLKVDVGSSGELREIVLDSFRADEEPSSSGPSISFGSSSDEGPMAIVKFIAHVALFILLLVLFFRRLDVRLVDLRGAFRDGLFGGFLGLISTGLVIGYAIGLEAGFEGISLLVAFVISLVAAAMTLVVTFVASAVGDSYVRESWPESVRPLDLVRQLSFINQPIGFSLIHGVAVSGVLVATGVLALHIPGANLLISGEFPTAASWRPVLSHFTDQGWLALYLIFAVAAAVGGWLRSKYTRASVIVPIAIFGLIDVSAVPIDSLWLAPIVSLVSGAIIMWCFARHGVVAAIVAFVVSRTAVSLAPGWLAAPVPETFDFIVGVLIVGVLLIIGFIGAASSRRIEQRTIYVPPYVREHSEQQRIERELEIARSVQMSFLPRSIPRVGGVDAAALCIPAHEVGGDYYDAVILDQHRMAIMIGDVSGKGIKAAFYMTLVKGVIQSLALSNTRPREVLNRLNEIFCRTAPRGTFVSLIYGVFDSRTGKFTYARAGHNPVLVTHKGEAVFERPAGMAIGLTSGKRFDAALNEHSIVVEPDEALLLYTDGVSEAMNTGREQFGEDRIARMMIDHQHKTAAAIVDDLRREIENFTAQAAQSDDLTLIVLRRVGEVDVVEEQAKHLSSLTTVSSS